MAKTTKETRIGTFYHGVTLRIDLRDDGLICAYLSTMEGDALWCTDTSDRLEPDTSGRMEYVDDDGDEIDLIYAVAESEEAAVEAAVAAVQKDEWATEDVHSALFAAKEILEDDDGESSDVWEEECADRGVEVDCAINGQGRGDGWDATAYLLRPEDAQSYGFRRTTHLIRYTAVGRDTPDRWSFAEGYDDMQVKLQMPGSMGWEPDDD